MAMTFYRYRYYPKRLVVTIDDKEYKFDERCIDYLSIAHDYTNRRFPIIFMRVEADNVILSKIYDNIKKARAKLDIVEDVMKADTDEIVSSSMYMQKSFTMIPRNVENNYYTKGDSKTDEIVDEMRNPQMFECYLIDIDAVKWFTQQLSVIVTGSKAEALQALFQMRNIPNKIIVATPPLDTSTKTKIVLPLGDLCGNVDMLNKKYGLYDSYPIVYYDTKYLYCVSKMKPNITIKSSTDFNDVTFVLRNKDGVEEIIEGSYDDRTKKIHYTYVNREPSITKNNLQAGSTKFSTITSINKGGTVNKRTVDTNATALEYVYEQNDLTVEQNVNENLSGDTISLVMSNNNLTCIKPWKSFWFDVDGSYMSLGLHDKEYRILNWKVIISRNGIGEYTHTTTMTLRDPEYNQEDD